MDVQDAFWEEMRAMLGAEYGAFFEAMQDPPQSALRLNRLRAGANWGGAPAGARVAWEADGYYLDAPFKPGRELEHVAGAYYMQEPSAMASARVLDVRPGELALDLCAAPGGKSGQIAAALAGAGALVSNEIELPRARMLAGNLERLGASRAVVVSAPAAREPCTAPAAPPSDCISVMRTFWPNRLVRPCAAHSSATSAIGEEGVIG